MFIAMNLLLERITQLIGTPSVSAVVPEFDMPNRKVIDLLANWLTSEGFAVRILPVSEDGQKANLIASKGKGPGGLILSGHTDTVPFDDGKWQSDPFKATERDGFLYGLGSSDMKSFFAVAMEASRRFDASKLKEPILILATADEECGMSGIRALQKSGIPKARHAIIGEPTNLRPIRMHKGVSMEYLDLIGRSGHSSDPSLGRSALEGMRRAMNAVVEVREELARAHRNEGFVPPTTTMNLGNIHGGDNPNRICAHCQLQFDVRVLPGLDLDQVRHTLHERIRQSIEGLDLTFTGGPLHEPVPPFETPADAAIVRAAEELTGFASGSVSFGTEAPFFSQEGLPTIVLGPGDIAVAHQPNECIELATLPRAVDLIANLIARFCL